MEARKAFLFENDGPSAALGEECRNRGAGRAAADNHNIAFSVICHCARHSRQHRRRPVPRINYSLIVAGMRAVTFSSTCRAARTSCLDRLLSLQWTHPKLRLI